jgi:hypothetical protein
MAIPKRFFKWNDRARSDGSGRSRLCEDANGLAASFIAKEEFNGTGAGVSYLFDPERHNYAQDLHHETYNNRTSNGPRPPKQIRSCRRHIEL